MNALEAKKLAGAHKKAIEDNIRIRNEKAVNTDVDLLYNHFHDKIDKAVKEGKLSTEGMEFNSDRWPDHIVSAVADKVRAEGFSINMVKQNAYQKTTFTVNWS